MLFDKSQLSVLVVDDDDSGRDMLARRLSREDFNVASVESGAAALERVALEKFDIVLLDLMMPDMSGDQVLDELRKIPSMASAVVIMLTADSSRESVATCLQRGADDYVVKPFDFLMLKTRIWRAIKSRAISNRGKVADKRLLVDKHVLIVDDLESNRDILSYRCQQFGCETETVASGEEALQRLAERPFDVVLLDIRMPGMNGIEVLREIRKQKQFAELPVIMVTAEDGDSVMADCLNAGASDYISKPFNSAVIRARMQSCLRALIPEDDKQ